MTSSMREEIAEPYERLKELLREMFQLDRGDLDFGLYRIMNMKAAEVGQFLDRDLLPQVKQVLAGLSEEEIAIREEQIEKARKAAHDLGVDPSAAPKIQELEARLAGVEVHFQDEADVCRQLANFFARYYREGDFLSLRRYGSGGRPTYLLPYDGEEVKLHWANADQYYVKTTENYAAYAFVIGNGDDARRVRFEIAAADNEKDNIKEANGRQRRFVLMRPASRAIQERGAELAVSFEHRPLTEAEQQRWPGNGSRQQDRINRATVATVFEALAPEWRQALATPDPTDADPERNLLGKNIDRYTAKNSFDYFIHKDLGGFLRWELDLFTKTDVLNLDDLKLGDGERLNRASARMKAVLHVGGKVIDFLAQIENFQKRLWLKKKFVLETQWCVTLDRLPEDLYPEVAANDAQREEWVRLFAIDEIKSDLGNGGGGYSKPLSVAFLQTNPHLVLDTRHFDAQFKDRLLAALAEAGPLDEQTGGLLVHGENFQALSLIEARYLGQVQCAHIDPPYNTQTSGFLYKNGYRHSSWMAMMNDRILATIPLLQETGSVLCHIDENEHENLELLFSSTPIASGGTVIWDKKNPMLGAKGIATQHEYILWRTREEFPIFMRCNNAGMILQKAREIIEKHGRVSDDAKQEFHKWVTNQETFSGGETAYRHLDKEGRVYQSVGMGAPEYRIDRKFHIPLDHPDTGKSCPVPPNGWSRSPDTLQKMAEDGEVIFGKDETVQPRRKVFLRVGKGRQMPSVISNAARGKGDVDRLGLEFPYCHPVSLYEDICGAALPDRAAIALDYFAGSGTTGHAVINLNRADGGERKYILVEMGDHFDTVLLPRLKKVVYSPDWKDGKPVSRGKGASQLIKCLRLESYEDTLDGLELDVPDQGLLARSGPKLAEDYRLRYALDAETRASPCLLGKQFADPFAYRLSVVRDGYRREIPADLPETFNYLLGLQVRSRKRLGEVLAIEGIDPSGRHCLILWRNLEVTDNAALENWFASQRKEFSASLGLIHVNGDHTLNAIRRPEENWIAETIEPRFRQLMFETGK